MLLSANVIASEDMGTRDSKTTMEVNRGVRELTRALTEERKSAGRPVGFAEARCQVPKVVEETSVKTTMS